MRFFMLIFAALWTVVVALEPAQQPIANRKPDRCVLNMFANWKPASKFCAKYTAGAPMPAVSSIPQWLRNPCGRDPEYASRACTAFFPPITGGIYMPQTITETSTKTEKFTETVTSYITSATGGTSAPAACDKIGEENADNIAYFNNVEDVNTCNQRCQTNANCKSWGLYTGSKTCALYDKQASQVFVEKATGDAIYSDKVASCVISSSPAPAPVPASAPATYCNKIGEEAADSIDFVNGVAGVEACNSRCKQNAACQSWGLFQPGSVCSLYDLPASQAFLEKANGDATFSDKVASCSGSSPAPAPGPAPGPASVPRCNKIGEEHADGIDFAFGVFNVETCNSNCQQNADCKSWGLFPASNVCVLYDIPASQSFIEKASGDATFSDKVTSCAATT